jgi:hypothetical protein
MLGMQQKAANTEITVIDELGIKVDPVLGRVYNKFNDKPIVPFVDHYKGATMMVRCPINLGHELGMSRNMRLSRIICFVAHGSPKTGQYAYHLDRDFMNNKGNNLIWDDGHYSSQQAVLTGRALTKMLAHVNTVRTLAANGFKNLDALGAVYRVHPGTIRNIIRGKTFGYIPYIDDNFVNSSIVDTLIGEMDSLSKKVDSVKQEHRS